MTVTAARHDAYINESYKNGLNSRLAAPRSLSQRLSHFLRGRDLPASLLAPSLEHVPPLIRVVPPEESVRTLPMQLVRLVRTLPLLPLGLEDERCLFAEYVFAHAQLEANRDSVQMQRLQATTRRHRFRPLPNWQPRHIRNWQPRHIQRPP